MVGTSNSPTHSYNHTASRSGSILCSASSTARHSRYAIIHCRILDRSLNYETVSCTQGNTYPSVSAVLMPIPSNCRGSLRLKRLRFAMDGRHLPASSEQLSPNTNLQETTTLSLKLKRLLVQD